MASKKMAIIATKGALDMAYPPLILASTAAAMGWEVKIFFTFYGLQLLRKDLSGIAISPLANPAMPMPILAQNLDVPEFPFTITLDNSMTMMGATLESVSELVVGARLSRAGGAIAQSGDLQATLSDPFVLTELTAPLELLIDEAVP